MKRLTWMLIFPYVVIHSDFKGTTNYSVVNSSHVAVENCGTDQSFCEDYSRSLNEAHELNEVDTTRSGRFTLTDDVTPELLLSSGTANPTPEPALP
jgi:hypothetical protein